MDSAIHIGNLIDEEYGLAQAKSIIEILESDVSDDVKKHALDTLKRMSKVENITLTGANIDDRQGFSDNKNNQ